MSRKHLLESVEQFLPGSVGAFRSRQYVEVTRFDFVDQLLRLAVRWNEIEPAARHHQLFGQPKYAICNGIAVMVIVEQPGVEVAFAEGRLNGGKVHWKKDILNNLRDLGESAGYGFSTLRTCAAVQPVTRMILFRLPWPETMVTDERGNLST